MTVTLYMLEQSRAERIQWLLEELGIDFKTTWIKRGTKEAEDLKKIHPLGKSPMIEDDGTVVTESGLICEYLIDKYGAENLKPNNSDDALKVKELSWHSESSLSVIFMLLYISWNIKTKSPFFVRPLARMVADGADSAYAGKQIKLHFEYLNKILEANPSGYFVGDHLTAADILEHFPVHYSKMVGFINLDDYPAVKSWLERMEARPAYKKAWEDLARAEAAGNGGTVDCGPKL